MTTKLEKELIEFFEANGLPHERNYLAVAPSKNALGWIIDFFTPKALRLGKVHCYYLLVFTAEGIVYAPMWDKELYGQIEAPKKENVQVFSWSEVDGFKVTSLFKQHWISWTANGKRYRYGINTIFNGQMAFNVDNLAALEADNWHQPQTIATER